MEKNAKILIAGASGMVGSQLVKQLIEIGYNNLLTPAFVSLSLSSDSLVIFGFAS
jgi:nucleoside-diphosphate-sugar epimerase